MTHPIRKLIHAVDPYEGFNPSNWPDSPDGWNGLEHTIAHMAEKHKPKLTIEVGSWKGQSAITLGTALKRNDGHLLCVDTWLGSREFWTDHRDGLRYKALGLANGYPTVYWRFLANIVRAGLAATVTPFPQTSITAARFLTENKVTAGLIYVDASHDEQDIIADLRCWWPLVEKGGTMFGDDYHETQWPGVVYSVNGFAKNIGVKVKTEGRFWILEKGADCGH